MIVEPVGETGLRIRFDGGLVEACAHARAARDAIVAAFGDGIRDAWQGARSLMLDLREAPSRSTIETIRTLSGSVRAQDALDTTALTAVPVRYDGPDLEELAHRCRLSIDALIELHSSAVYSVAFIGFAPGFPYLFGTPEPLASVPRRASPRPRVPRNALAIAGGWTGIYPSEMPGGWHLLGTLGRDVFDPGTLRPTDWQPAAGFRFEPT